MSTKKGRGWVKDYPGFRDNVPDTNVLSKGQKSRGNKAPVGALLSRLQKPGKKKIVLPVKTDLRKWCSPIDDQGEIGSCTAHAGTALYEYFERRAFGKHIDASRLFLYKVTRNLLGW